MEIQHQDSISSGTESFNRTKASTYGDDLLTFTSTNNASIHHLNHRKGIVGNEIYTVFSIILTVCLSGTCGVLGIVTNGITIVAFKRQGLKDSVNISLFGLAIADMFCVTTMLWSSVCTLLLHANAPPFLFDPRSLQLMTASYPRVIATRLTCWMTALISIERCLCVTLPLKVKTLFTRTKAATMTIMVFITVIASYTLQLYSVRKLSLVFNVNLNMTQYFIFVDKKNTAQKIVKGIWHTLLPIISLLIIIACAVVMVTNLKTSLQWRMNAMTGYGQDREDIGLPVEISRVSWEANRDLGKSDTRSKNKAVTKEAKLTRMVLIITTLFILCNGPSTVSYAVTFFIPEFQSTGRYRNLFYITNMFLFLMETINSSVNLFVFYNMSSKFKSEVDLMFPDFTKRKKRWE